MLELLRKVEIASPEKRIKDYPHQLSGGMRQRVMIAMALAQNASVIIADEPTTALDVTIQAQILTLLKELKHSIGKAMMLITHDMGVVAEMSDKIMVMYAGMVMEYGTALDIFKQAKHPYTQGLLASIPRTDKDVEELFTIEGTVPTLQTMPKGCRFCTRCKEANDRCFNERPSMFTIGTQQVRCWKYA
ncbi:Oligopeptide transport ATP-binding protein OppD [bioreactor metagenome]|uniref:Oligopeptide transport ATP-binding protein OppD n=1 Tax=bioreactor metagenome TaxID=1076179 RepID=A0A645HZD8_9ZZZZ